MSERFTPISEARLKVLIGAVEKNIGQNREEWDDTYAALMELAQHRQAVEDGRWVELPEWPIPVNKQMGRYRIAGADATAKTITLEDCGANEAALLKEKTE